MSLARPTAGSALANIGRLRDVSDEPTQRRLRGVSGSAGRAWSIGRIGMNAASITPTGLGAERMPIASALLLTVEQAAQCLQVSRSSLYREIRRGHLGVVKLGHLTRIRQEDLQVYVSALAPPRR